VRRACLCHLLLIVPLLGVGSGSAGADTDLDPPGPPPTSAHGVVFALDGAGGWHISSGCLRDAVTEAGLPLYVQTLDWSHGHGRILSDHCHCAYARAAGERLAGKILEYRQSCPTGEVYLVSHSAGCMVVLAAAEHLPPGSITRVILLAPSVSSGYDLRPALRASCQGIDIFCSRRDCWCLGFWITILGTADRCWGATAAGRFGFRPIITCPEDEALYARLHHHPWQPDEIWTGNCGGHYGAHQPAFLSAFVLPLLTCGPHR